MDKEPSFITQHVQYPSMEQEGLEEEETSESHHLLGNGSIQLPVPASDTDKSQPSYLPTHHIRSYSGIGKKGVGRNWPWRKIIVFAVISLVAFAFGVAVAISLPLSLHLTNKDHQDDTFVYTAGNTGTLPNHIPVWLTTVSTFWYKSMEVELGSSSTEDLHTARVYAVPLHEYRQTAVINDTCDGGTFVPPRPDIGLQLLYLYAHLPFSYDGCVTNPAENNNSVKVQAAIFRLSSKRESDMYLHYLQDGNTTFALNITSVTTARPGETKCVHLEMVIPRNTFYYVTMVILNDSTVSHPVNYSCYSLKEHRDFDRKLHHPICNLDATKPCFYSLYNGSFINTHSKKLAIVAEVSKSSPSDVPTTTLTVHSRKSSEVVNLGVIIGVIVAVIVMILILALLVIACVRMYLTGDRD